MNITTNPELVNLKIAKRNGEIVEFDSSKIKNAIQKAVIATKQKLSEEILDEIVSDICVEISERFVDFYPNVENVQDIVEKHLVKKGLYEIAKSYILYRAKRMKEREEEKKQNLEKARLGKLKVKKIDGRTVLFDLLKIQASLKRAARGYETDVSIDLISKEMIKNIYDGISTKEIEKALMLSVISFIERDPAYNYIAAKLFMQKLSKEVFGKSVNQDLYELHYKQAFVEGIRKGVEANLFDKRLLDFDLTKLADGLLIDRDELLQYMGIQTLYERYFVKTDKKRLELPQSFWMRVAMGLTINEKNKEQKAIEFYDALSSLRFVSSTPTLFHSGLPKPQLSSCYLTTVNDDLTHIFKAVSDNAQLSKWSGGLGNDWTNIRATGAMIKSTNVESQGVIPFLKIANDVTAAINRSGKRRGATCAYLECWHLDFEDFLDLRKNTGDERRRTHDMNTAAWIPDLFMKRIQNNDQWTLFSPEEVPDLHHLYGRKFEKKYIEYEKKAQNGVIRKHKSVPAQKLWRKMLSMLFETGHPWITFKDPCNLRSPQDHAGVIHSSNLCTEITLNTSEDETAVCNLGSVNLLRHIMDGRLDHDLLAATVKTGVRMLDNVIDINYYPTKEAEVSNFKHRPIGLGIMGFQDALYMLDINFDSQEAVDFSDKSMELISYHAILASSELALEKGAYGSFKGSKWDNGIFPVDTLNLLEEERGMKIDLSREEHLDWSPVRMHVKRYGMRNSNVMAMAPTATISTIAGCYPTIEPIYKNIYVKSNMTGEFTVVNSFLVNDLKKLKLWNQEMLDQLKYHDGNLNLIAAIPEKIRHKYKTAFDLDTVHMVKVAAVRGKWIDQSQSFNVFIRGTSGTKLSETYFAAWNMGLKTTYYLRTLGASQIEKSTLDASKFGYTQKREYKEVAQSDEYSDVGGKKIQEDFEETAAEQPKLCLIDDPDCEACQ